MRSELSREMGEEGFAIRTESEVCKLDGAGELSEIKDGS